MTKILWSVNTLPPEIAKKFHLESQHAISWIEAMGNKLKENTAIKLAIVSPGKKFQKILHDKILYYIIPQNSKNFWQKILNEFKPDIIHIYGTEKTHNIDLIRGCKNIPIVISLQGIITGYMPHYFGGLEEHEIRKNLTFRDLLLRDDIFHGKKDFAKQIPNEQWMLKHVNYVEGRSDWDRANALYINSKLKYYYCPRMIKNAFFDYHWDCNHMEPYSLLIHQGNYPIKGLHFMLDAMGILKEKYPHLKLYIAGNNNIQRKGIKKKLSTPGYAKILRRKINKYNLEKNIIFTGFLNTNQMAKKLSEVNICVIPSAIENAPNALAEAMIVGTPCIASYVGGNAHMLNYGACGLLYCYNDPIMLANCISEIFNSVELANNLSLKSKEVSHYRHDPDRLEELILNIYNNIINDFKISIKN